MKTKSKFFILTIMFTTMVFHSCTNDTSQDIIVSADAILVVEEIEARAAMLRLENIISTQGHSFSITKKEDGSVVAIADKSGFLELKDLEPSQTYIAEVQVEGYDVTPYNTVTFTTSPFDFVSGTNMEGGGKFETETGFMAELQTNGNLESNLNNSTFFLVDRENDQLKVQLNAEMNDATLRFEIPEEALSMSTTLRKSFQLHLQQDGGALQAVVLRIGDNLNTKVSITVYRAEAYIGSRLDPNALIVDSCDIKTFQANFEGFFYWSGAEGYDNEKISLIIKNVDNGREMILIEPKNDKELCNRFYFGLGDSFEWKGLIPQVLYVQFIEDEALGLVAGNYSVRVIYELADGFHDSNTFEFVVE